MRCKWIIITGLDGSGKTTLQTDLMNYLENQNKTVKRYHSPYDDYLKSLLDLSGNGIALKDSYTDLLIFALFFFLEWFCGLVTWEIILFFPPKWLIIPKILPRSCQSTS